MRDGVSRRSLLAAMVGSVPLLGDGVPVCEEVKSPNGWCSRVFRGRTVFYRGTGAAVVLLHEINGLSPGCVDLGMELVANGFTVHIPLLFGHPMQDNIVFGYMESCWHSFSCSSEVKDSKISRWLRVFVEDLGTRMPDGTGIGVIGMCLTGGLPLSVMKGTRVRAAVMSQPALPFGSKKQESVGVSETTMSDAKQSGVPILAFRFSADTLCTGARFAFLRAYFGNQFDGHELPTPHGFHADWTHHAHAVLTGLFGEQKASARRKVFEFIRERLSGA